ncbi:MAG: hypothetical protein GX633_02585 [Clostridiales bacterium]|jgi:hypothetical protein|nr:hypothetical protein [Clostridiales bacterium]
MRKVLLRRVYQTICDATPLKSDCGKLCSNACCKGDSGSGMWLFPGEKEHLATNRNRHTFDILEGDAGIVVCSGSCERGVRPLSCRIFPIFPVTTIYNRSGKAKVTAPFDIRAIRICPLADPESETIEGSFRRRVRLAGKLLCRNREAMEFLKERSRELMDIARLL